MQACEQKIQSNGMVTDEVDYGASETCSVR